MSSEQASPGPDRLTWFKSSHSGSDGGDCVEVAAGRSGVVHVRDSKRASDRELRVRVAGWSEFVAFAAAADDERRD
ncbi:DUF397 domain-containing protein [Streptomyces sp. TP-A0874]|uniref:DUF397 domain-containing protein n=1 Tax=Streptomyces sp. TP-A0874 TaxID=549819 RepID=UPI0008531A63|nr:DUF397 domain-containing protein [Streptomyces sp. TP-A0874]